ncbi:fanconi-associated nuclease 1-like isoform X2 [Aphidius gifuensis]|nr:fanconi-associated nuclease 1-like isoform X2 [Aphidius gifuensis]
MTSSQKPRYVEKAVIVISDDDEDDVPSTQYLTQEPSQSTSTEIERVPSITSQVLHDISACTQLHDSSISQEIATLVTREYSLDKHQDNLYHDANPSAIETRTNDSSSTSILSCERKKNINNNILFEDDNENIFDNNNCSNNVYSSSKLKPIYEDDENNQSFNDTINNVENIITNVFTPKSKSAFDETVVTLATRENSFHDNEDPFKNDYQDENINVENQEIDTQQQCQISNINESQRTSFIRVKSVNTINNIYDNSLSQIASQSTSQFNNYTSDNLSQTPIKGSQYLMWEKTSLKRSLDLNSVEDCYSSPSKKSLWNPRSPIKSSQESLSRINSFSPRKILTEQTQDKSSIPDAIENLNFFKQHVIVENDFNLDEIYSSKFIMPYGPVDTKTSIMFDYKDLNIPRPECYQEKDAERLFMLIIDVFINPINPGYFTEDEIDMIYSIMTLSIGAQILLSRMIRRKIRWTRKRDFEKEEIDGSIDLQLKELINRKLLITQCDNFDLDVVLEMMSRDEVSLVCKMMKVSVKGTKAIMIQKLIELSNKKPLFSGMKTPRKALQEAIDSINGECFKVADITMNIIRMLVTLIYPVQDPEKSIADAFFVFHEVHHSGKKIFPKYSKKRYPIFKNRKHLIDFIVAKNQWTVFLNLMLQKNKDETVWNSIEKIGDNAIVKLKHIFANLNEEEEYQLNSNVPSHVKRFMPIYIWGKILFGSVEAYKKLDNYNKAIDVLKFLISNRSHIQGKFIKWYVELSQIQMNRMKDLEMSAETIMTALAIPNITDSDKNELIHRARILSARSKNISADTKILMKQQVDLHADNFVFNANETIVTAYMMEGFVGNKSTWQLKIDNVTIGYSNVEKVAIQHYIKYENFTNGIHCEGSLAVTLFTCLFWNEIYDIFVPGAFVCPYQPAPLDIFGSKFMDNRHGKIDDKIQQINNLSNDEFIQTMVNCYTTYRVYDCLIANITDDPIEFQEIVESLGKSGVIAISMKIASNLSVWQSGFPDLFLWNRNNKTCKIVEVKGPGDILSVKQKLWIDYLQKNYIPVDVCHVRAANKYS